MLGPAKAVVYLWHGGENYGSRRIPISVKAGTYYILVEYGKWGGNYKYGKDGPIDVFPGGTPYYHTLRPSPSGYGLKTITREEYLKEKQMYKPVSLEKRRSPEPSRKTLSNRLSKALALRQPRKEQDTIGSHPIRPFPQQRRFPHSPRGPVPKNGATRLFHKRPAVAPLEILTRAGSGHYYVKLGDWHNKRDIMTVFVREGQRASVKVPLGSYEIRYAVGKNWFGPKFLFGPDTICSRAKEQFNFRRQGDRIRGYTVELFLQPQGNLKTQRMSKEDF